MWQDEQVVHLVKGESLPKSVALARRTLCGKDLSGIAKPYEGYGRSGNARQCRLKAEKSQVPVWSHTRLHQFQS